MTARPRSPQDPAAPANGGGLTVAGIRLHPDRSGALVWPERKLVVFSDLHLEKGSSFARRGFLLPPYDSTETLRRMRETLARIAPRRVICLGDSFHDAAGPERLAPDDRKLLADLTGRYEWLWILGNHDPALPDWLGGRRAGELHEGLLRFRHEPTDDAPPGEIVGHLHPKASIVVSGRRVTRRCFVTDGARLVLPAFGAYTGGLDIRDAAFSRLFPRRLEAWLLGRRGSHRITLRKGHGTVEEKDLNRQPYLPALFQEKNLKC